MHRYLIASVALTFGIGAASAADLGAPAPARISAHAPVAEPYSWNGFYVGANAGYGSVDPTSTESDTFALPGTPPNFFNANSMTLNKSGALAGGQIGYNYQFAPTWVAGIEADFDWANIRASANAGSLVVNPYYTGGVFVPFPGSAVTTQATYKDPWSIRGRIGYAQPAYMVYATGGFAQMDVNFSGNTILGTIAPGYAAPASLSQERSGWVAGAGIEWKPVPGPWIVGLEYLHYQFEGTSVVSAPITPFNICPSAGSCLHYSLGNIDLDSVRVRLSYKFTN